MRKDAGMNTDVDRIPQLSWMLFLKCFEDLEVSQSAINPQYKKAIPKGYRWQDWATDIKFTGSDLINFVNNKLFPTLSRLKGSRGLDQRDFIAGIFNEMENKIRDGYILRQIIDHISKISFVNKDNINTMAFLYEEMLAELRAAGDNGEFYTPRPVIQFIIEQIKPDISKSEKVLDPACGTGGFLIGTLDYVYSHNQVKTKSDLKWLREDMLIGTDKKPLPYQLCVMNMLLHNITKPNIRRINPLMKPFTDISVTDQYDVIMTNPPFGGEEESSIAGNLPTRMQTTDTALAFLVYIMRSLKNRGRCAIILPNGTLFSGNVGARIREELIKNFNLHTIVRLPESVFAPYVGIATNILFFDKTEPTKYIWYYKMKVSERVRSKAKHPKYSKTRPIMYEDFQEVEKWFKKKNVSKNSWKVCVKDLVDYNLDVQNPQDPDVPEILPPHKLIADAILIRREEITILESVKKIIDRELPQDKSLNQ